MTVQRLILFTSAVVVFILAAGCESVPVSNETDFAIFGEPHTATVTIGAAQTHIQKTGKRTYRIHGGDDDKKLVHRETYATNRFNAAWMTVESLVTSAGPMPRNTEYWSINNNGDAVLHASVDHGEKAVTLFKPPLVTMPAELQPDEQHTYTAKVRIVNEDNISRRKENGTATQTITYESAVRMRAPKGEVTTAMVVIEFNADLTLAGAKERTVRYIAEEEGIIAIKRSRTITILGITGREHTETLQLLSSTK